MINRIELKDITTNGTSLEDLVAAYNQFTSQDFVKEVIQKSANPQYQKSVIVDTIFFSARTQALKR